MAAFNRIRSWSFDARFTLAAAVALIVGSLGPWVGSPGDQFFSGDDVSGVETNAGALTLVVGVIAVWVLNRRAGPRAAAESGAITSLAVLAGALVLATLIEHWTAPYAPQWGMWVSGFAALGLFIGPFLILGESDETPSPPD
jgi:hypothetical protein